MDQFKNYLTENFYCQVNSEPLKCGKKYHVLGVFNWHGEPLKRGKKCRVLTVQGNNEAQNVTKIALQNVVKSTTF